ncbi:MAG TPA: RsmG family class I SAM-dependent methyltransferase [Vicinamibacterales bacterium]|nr:RsmG family class I SAM-dependent methyltransferase [Vicinamibacterales bacterium]
MTPTVFSEQLARRAAAAGVAIASEAANRLHAYFELLVHWNRRINLTSLALDPPTDQAVDRLIVEPLVAASLVAPTVGIWFDLGSGGGSPAIPLEIVHPAGQLIMVESRERKAAFLREAVRELELIGADVWTTRIETLVDDDRNVATADLVTVRAVRLSAPLFSQLDKLLRIGGQAILFGTAPQTLSLPPGLDIQRVEPPLVALRRTSI